MTDPHRKEPVELGNATRMLLAAGGAGLLALLLAAAWLEPDARGYGTHEQFGLRPCSFQTLFGTRCPSCGMTTSWAFFVRGQLVRALQTNVAGTMLACVAAVAGPWAIVSGCRNRWLGGRPGQWTPVTLVVCVVVIALCEWSVRLLVP